MNTKSLLYILLLCASNLQAQDSKPKENNMGVPCAIVGGLIGGYAIWRLWKFCDQHLPPSTNSPPSPPPRRTGTNQPSRFAGQVRIQLPPDNIPTYNIRGYGWTNDAGELYICSTEYGIQSSTNLKVWSEEFRVKMWATSNEVAMVATHDGLSVTNFSQIGSGAIDLEMPNMPLKQIEAFKVTH